MDGAEHPLLPSGVSTGRAVTPLLLAATLVACARDPQLERARRQLAEALEQLRAGHDAEAVTLAEPWLGTSRDAEAAYIVGHALVYELDTRRGRHLLERSFVGHYVNGSFAAAAKAADSLSRSPDIATRFDERLRYLQWADRASRASGNDGAIARTATALGEMYDDIGQIEDARTAFGRALDAPSASLELGLAQMKYGIFLIDLADSIDDGIAFLKAARETLTQAHQLDRWLDLALQLNTAFGLAQQGELAGAEATLTFISTDAGELRKLALVRGYIAALRGDIDGAQALFATGLKDEADLGYRWQAARALAHAYAAAGNEAAAERSLLDAIAAVEAMRGNVRQRELRPWALARSQEPYVELLALQARGARGLEALATAESLHARALYDHAVATDTLGAGDDRALRAARIRTSDTAPALGSAELLDKLDGREALVFVSSDDQTWRIHVKTGVATVVALTRDQAAAVARFADDPGDTTLAAAAGEALLPAGAISGTDPLYIVPSHQLKDLLFAALRRDGKALGPTRPVVHMPGLAMLGCDRPRAWTSDRVYVGDSGANLSKAREELIRVASGTELLGDKATIAAIQAHPRAELLYAAVHGGSGALTLHEGLFTAARVLDEHIGPRSVMLTGCSTATSDDAEGFGGFPSAFIANGSQHVVATLRDVDDAEAATFMQIFNDLPESLGFATRLAATQRIAVETTTLPARAWASFTVWGDDACRP